MPPDHYRSMPILFLKLASYGFVMAPPKYVPRDLTKTACAYCLRVMVGDQPRRPGLGREVGGYIPDLLQGEGVRGREESCV